MQINAYICRNALYQQNRKKKYTLYISLEALRWYGKFTVLRLLTQRNSAINPQKQHHQAANLQKKKSLI